jgi:hypothetical protein
MRGGDRDVLPLLLGVSGSVHERGGENDQRTTCEVPQGVTAQVRA